MFRYILLKELNMLLTMEYASKQENIHFPNPERIDKVIKILFTNHNSYGWLICFHSKPVNYWENILELYNEHYLLHHR